MKTTMIILTAMLALQINLLIAGNTDTKGGVIKETTAISTDNSNHTTQKVAVESVVLQQNFDESVSLAPKTPKEADFEETDDLLSNNLKNFSPIVPSEADFE